MSKLIDMTGEKCGRLTVLRRQGSDKHKNATWNCLCDCGNESIVPTYKLRSGHTQSCGCYNKQRTAETSFKHGHSHGVLEYEVWASMIQRCTNPDNKDYANYGGRGIGVSDEWKTYSNFIKDMGTRPTRKHTLERVNNEDGYNKGNCIWDNRTNQARNQRIRKDNTTGTRGVQWDKDRNKYRVTITHNKKKIYIGLYVELEKAVEARKQAELKYWGESSL